MSPGAEEGLMAQLACMPSACSRRASPGLPSWVGEFQICEKVGLGSSGTTLQESSASAWKEELITNQGFCSRRAAGPCFQMHVLWKDNHSSLSFLL